MAVLNSDGTLTPVPTRIDGNGTITVLIAGDVTLVPLNVRANFTDIDFGTPYRHVTDEINTAAARMLVEGIGGGRFGRPEPVTAAQTATMLLRAMGVRVEFATVMAMGERYGVTNSTMLPGGPMSRIATATMMVNALKYLGLCPAMTAAEADGLLRGFTDVGSLTAQERLDLAVCVKLGLFQGFGDGTMQPGAVLRRSHMARLAVRFQDFMLKS